MSSTAIVLAAGLGVRMKSKKPKVLHAAAGRPLIEHVVSGLTRAGVKKIRLVVGHGADEVQKYFVDRPNLTFHIQKNQWGTADAVKSADIGTLDGKVIICNGDHPLISDEDFKAAIEAFNEKKCDLMVITSIVKNPTSFGRIVRGPAGHFDKIVEEKEATDHQRKIREVNSGVYLMEAEVLKKYLPKIQNKNAKGEYYLTDLISICLNEGLSVLAHKMAPWVCRGVNNQLELAMASKALYARKARKLLEEGVVVIDPSHTYIESDVRIGAGTTIYPNCLIQGKTEIGEDCLVESHCQIRDATISEKVEIRWGTLIEKSEIKTGAVLGPYARIRPESIVGEGTHIGNFVELKKAKLEKGVKANHLTYLGDVEIGEGTNIGCGTITCNYAVDRNKYKTVIGKNVFVGSDCQFVAPVKVGDEAVIGSGSTITEDVPAKALAIARGRQVVKENYNKKNKNKEK